MTNLIQIEQLSFGYKKDRLLYDNLNFQVKKGEWIGLIGASGLGKTTLLRFLNGSHKEYDKSPSHVRRGRVMVLGKDMMINRHIPGIIMTIYQYPDHQLVFTHGMDELLFGMENFSLSPYLMKERIDRVTRAFDMEDLMNKNPSNLSGGEKQVMVLGSVLCLEPDILLLDEAFSALDSSRVKKVLDFLETMHQEGLTIIMVDHKQEHLTYVDRIVELKDKSLKDVPVLKGDFKRQLGEDDT